MHQRERDLRLKGEFEGPAGGVSEKSGETQGVSQAMFAGVDPDLNWEDIKWIKSQSDLPIIVKGIQCVEVCFAIQEIERVLMTRTHY
jgi:L-lactate dehydrogenase (cytochrome)